jgi:hypothetical protein
MTFSFAKGFVDELTYIAVQLLERAIERLPKGQ